MNVNDKQKQTDFIREIVKTDLESGGFEGRVHTRFPPEPNGYLHIGHAKAICIDFGIAEDFGGLYNLRFDDTNPTKEEVEYVNSIIEDIRWLGYDWKDRLFYASDYFEQLYEWALELIKAARAYVDDLSAEEIREYRGTLTEPGRNSPYRGRSIAENLDLFKRMRAGEFPNGSRVLRAKIDMSSGNINLRDPVMYRIIHAAHHRTGTEWCIYPMYDYAHGQSDSLEGITHSLCDIAYEIHRPLYDWFLDELNIHHPRQIEFARLNLSHTILSKRRLITLVKEGYVNGWDDPRLPTLSGLRRRGVPPTVIRTFCNTIGVAKHDSLVDMALFEHHIRQELNQTSPRVMGVLHPLKVIITNYPVDKAEYLDAVNNPEDKEAGTRKIPFSNELYIEQSDFQENPPKKYFRLAPGREVRLRYGYFITCVDVIKDEKGNIIELHCTYDPETRGGYAPDGRKVRGTIHWVSARHSIEAEIRLYDRLFTVADPLDTSSGKHFTDFVNPNSLEISIGKLEPSMKEKSIGNRVQFERLGYFCVDYDSSDGKLVVNRTISLRDSWSKMKPGKSK